MMAGGQSSLLRWGARLPWGERLPWGASRLALGIAALLCTAIFALTAPLPALTGRIVDQANVIPAETQRTIEPKLSELESKSGIQLAVATVTSLEGQEVEPY